MNRCRYTRYADDITFSCDVVDFPSDVAFFDGTRWVPGTALEAAIGTESFKINQAKTTMRVSGARQMVTGLIVNEKVNVTRAYLQSVRGMLWALESKGVNQAGADFHAHYEVKTKLQKEEEF